MGWKSAPNNVCFTPDKPVLSQGRTTVERSRLLIEPDNIEPDGW